MPSKFFTFLIALTCLISASTFQLDIPKKLWVYWDSKIETAPLIVQMCVQKIRTTCEQSSWSLVILNQTNLPNYITNYETELIDIKKRSKHPQWKATFADLVRLTVLEQHGGVWIDISSILFKGLNWFEKLDEMPYLLTNLDIYKGEQVDVILPYITYHQNSAETRDSHGQITNWLPGYEVWFMAAKKNATFMHLWRKLYQKHYQMNQTQNFQQETDQNYYFPSVRGDYLNCQKSAYQIIQNEQARLDSNLTLFGQRKNANKEFKIVGFHGEFGPSLLFIGLTENGNEFLYLTVDQIEKKYYLSINFFLKLTSLNRPYYNSKLWRVKLISQKFNSTQNVFEQYMASKPQQYDCQEVTFIVQGSVFGELIKNNSIADKNGVFSITTQQRQQWETYCMTTWNISPNQRKLYWRFPSIIKWIGENQWIRHWISQSTITEFQETLKYLSNYIIFPPITINGLTGYPEENYYWKKFYSSFKSGQKQTQHRQDNRDESDTNSSKSQTTHVYSQSQLLWLKIKIAVFARRVNITEYCIAFCVIFSILILFGILHLCLLFCFTLLNLAFKYRIRTIPPLNQSFCSFRTQDTIYYTGKIWQSIIGTLNLLLSWITLQNFTKCLRSTAFCLLRFIFGLIFVAYNTFIAFYYVLIMKGKIYEQQLILLLVFMFQILFRFIGLKIGAHRWILPGLSFKLVFWLFLPFYFFYFGSSLLSLTEIIELKNLELGFFMCLGIPLLVKLVENEILNGFKIIIIQENAVMTQRTAQHILSFMSNLSGWIERGILVFLIMVNLVPNLRYMRFASGDKIMIKSLYESLVPLKYVLFMLLVCILAYKSYYLVYKFFKFIFDWMTNIDKNSDQNAPQSFQGIVDSPNSAINSEVFSLVLDSTKKQQKQNSISLKAFIIETLGSYTIMEMYIFRVYLIYVMLFGESHENMFRHLSLISIQESFTEDEQMPAYLLGLMLMIFLHFSVEIYLDREFYRMVKESTRSLGDSFEGLQLGMRQTLSIFDKRGTVHKGTEQEVRTSNSQDFRNVEIFFMVSQMGIMMAPRLLAINKFYMYFSQIEDGKEFNRAMFQQEITFDVGVMLLSIACGQIFIRRLIKKWAQHLCGKGYRKLSNGDDSFEEENEEKDEQEDNCL